MLHVTKIFTKCLKKLFFLISGETLSSHTAVSQTDMYLQNRYQISQNTSPPTSALLPPNILGPIGQPYSAELCNYGPVYHSHNILHNYNTVYNNDKTMRNGNFGRTVYGNYHGFYGNNSTLRPPPLHQNGYDFTPR